MLNTTHVPASTFEEAGGGNFIQDSKNNYWQLGCATGVKIDDKTDWKAECNYYRADDYQADWSYGVPYGDNSEEYTASTTISHQFTDRIRSSLKYSYVLYTDPTYGTANNYQGQSIYASTQIKF